MDKIKKLSDAIKLGATIRPQCFGSLFINDASCALGAALEAVYGWGSIREELRYYMLDKRFPELKKLVLLDGEAITLRSFIIHLNDKLHWSREKIAYCLVKKGL